MQVLGPAETVTNWRRSDRPEMSDVVCLDDAYQRSIIVRAVRVHVSQDWNVVPPAGARK